MQTMKAKQMLLEGQMLVKILLALVLVHSTVVDTISDTSFGNPGHGTS